MRALVYGVSGHLTGGIETFMLAMSEHMSAECVFDYVIAGDTCLHQKAIESTGGSVCFITPPRKGPIRHLLSLARLLTKNKKSAKLLYVHLFSMAVFPQVLLGRLYGYKVVLHAHNNGLQSRGAPFRLLHRLGKFLLKGGRYTRLTNSAASAKFMFGRPAELVYNAIDPDKFRFSPEAREKVRLTYGLSDKLVVGFAGRLCYPKNPERLIEIFANIHTLRPDAMLLVAGDGALLPRVEAAIKANALVEAVLLLGACSNVHELLSGMDMFLLPSRFEGLGIALIEAQAAGLPCVTTADVVPQEAKATELLLYVPRAESSEAWAKACLNHLSSADTDRMAGFRGIRSSGFNIFSEARRLETILLSAAHVRPVQREGVDVEC